jgi:hypothetical protein
MAVSGPLPVFRIVMGTAEPGVSLKGKMTLRRNGVEVVSFDQTTNPTGWDKGSYASGEIATFTPPVGFRLDPDGYQWQASASDGFQQSPVSAAADFQVGANVPRTVKGLGILGIGLTPDDPSRAGIGLSGMPMRAWDAATQTYTDVIGPLNATTGYWYRSSGDTAVRIAGRAPIGSTFVPLRAGWNLVNTGSPVPTPWSLANIQVDRLGERRSLAQAKAAGWVEDNAWVWRQDSLDPHQGRYHLVYDASVFPGAQGQLDPWQGFWVFAYQESILILPQPDSVAGRSASPSSGRSWALNIEAMTAGGGNAVVIGETPAAVTSGAPPAPPEGASSVRIVSRRGGVAFAADTRAASAGTTWDLEVNVDAVPANETVSLSWPGASSLPRGTDLVLVDQQNGTRRLLRTSSSYAFRATAAGLSRFRVESAPSTGALMITQAQARPGRGPGSPIQLSAVLSQAADVQVRILGADGRTVRTVEGRASRAAGVFLTTWDGRSQTGISMPAGSYVVELRASDSEGRFARALVPVVLTR